MEFTVGIKRVHFPKEKRILVVSDIHGHKGWLENLLRKMAFCQDDILVLGGDYIERGTENLACLRYVMDLCRMPNVYAIPGNIDAGHVVWIENPDTPSPEEILAYIAHKKRVYGTCTMLEMGQELGLPMETPAQVKEAKKAFAAAFAPELNFIRSLPVILEDDRFVFVHGGLTSTNLADLEGKPAFPLMKNDSFLRKGMSFASLGKTVVVGHTPLVNYCRDYPDHNPVIESERRIISIDGGCGVKESGQLNGMIFTGDKVQHVSYDQLPQLIALEDQQPSQNPINLVWVDSQVKVLKEFSHLCLVRRLSDGREFQVPHSYLYELNGVTHCQDYTDYHLPVKKGDKLGLVKEENGGRLVKKEGKLGWYFGKVEALPA